MKKDKILICDDEKSTRESLKFILEKKYKLSFATNGLEVIEWVKNHSTNLIILDIKMPNMDGLEVLKQVKKINPKIKVLILTGYLSQDIAREAIEYGAINYIIKPFGKAQILDAVQKALE